MTAPVTTKLQDCEQKIVAQLATVRAARAAYTHSPNQETARLVANADERLDWLIDMWCKVHIAEDADALAASKYTTGAERALLEEREKA
ncbi:MAG: hypothetical protein ACXVGF_04715 [Blastococcus sp.]